MRQLFLLLIFLPTSVFARGEIENPFRQVREALTVLDAMVPQLATDLAKARTATPLASHIQKIDQELEFLGLAIAQSEEAMRLLKIEVERRANAFYDAAHKFQWYQITFDDEPRWNTMIRLYLRVWVAQSLADHEMRPQPFERRRRIMEPFSYATNLCRTLLKRIAKSRPPVDG